MYVEVLEHQSTHEILLPCLQACREPASPVPWLPNTFSTFLGSAPLIQSKTLNHWLARIEVCSVITSSPFRTTKVHVRWYAISPLRQKQKKMADAENAGNAANAENGEQENHGRDIELEKDDAFWRSTGKYIWNKVMGPSGLTLPDGIEWSDLEGDNSSTVMSTFVNSCNSNPPVSQNGNSVHKEDSILKAFSAGTRKIKDKFRQNMRDDPSGEYFPEDLVADCRTKLKRKRGVNMMEGMDGSDLHKGTYLKMRWQRHREGKVSPASAGLLCVSGFASDERFQCGWQNDGSHSQCASRSR